MADDTKITTLIIRTTVEGQAQAKKALDDLGVSYDSVDKRVTQSASSLDKLAQKFNASYGIEQRYVAQQAQLQRAAEAYVTKTGDSVKANELLQVGLAGLADKYNANKARAEEAAHAVAEHGANAGIAARETRALFDEFGSGRYRQAVGSATILATRVFGISLTAIAATAAIVAIPVGLVLAAKGAEDSINRLDTALKGAGQSAGLSRGQIDAMARQIAADTGQSIGSVRDQATALLQIGGISGDTLRKLLLLGKDYAALTGETLPKAEETLAKAFTGPMSGLRALDDQFNFLTDTQRHHIEVLRTSGRETEAQTEALALYADRIKGASDQLGFFARNWEAVKRAASGAVDSLGNIGVPESPEQVIARTQQALDNLAKQRVLPAPTPSGQILGQRFTQGAQGQNRASLSAEQFYASQSRIFSDTAAGAPGPDLQKQGKDAGDLARALDELGSKREKLQGQLDQLNKAISAGVGPLEQERAAAAKLGIQLENLKSPYDKFIEGQKRAIQEAGLEGRALAEVQAVYQAQQAAIASGQPFGEKEAAAARAGADAHLEAARRVKDHAAALTDLIKIEQDNEKVLQSNIDLANKERDARVDTIAKLQQEADNTKALADVIVTQGIPAYQKLKAEQEALAKLGPGASQDQVQKVVDIADQTDKAKKVINDTTEAQKNWQSVINSTVGDASRLFENLATGTKNWRSALQNALQDVGQLLIKFALILPLEKQIAAAFPSLGMGGSSSGGSGGGFGGIFGSLFSGLGGLFGGGGGFAADASSFASIGGDFLGGGFFADGGIMTSRGPLPLNRYAGGGVANSPQLAMFGEGRKPEAYVPLPDGRSIPVTMQGNGGSQLTQHIYVEAGANMSDVQYAVAQGIAVATPTIQRGAVEKSMTTFSGNLRQGGGLTKLTGKRAK